MTPEPTAANGRDNYQRSAGFPIGAPRTSKHPSPEVDAAKARDKQAIDAMKASGTAARRERPVLIPRDPEKRAALANFAGLTDEERAALDQWCYDQEMERAQGVLLCEGDRHGPR